MSVLTRLGGSMPARLTWIVGLGTAIGYANTAASSWLLNALVAEKRVGIEQAGFVVSSESMAMALTMIVLAPHVGRFPRRATTLVCVGLVIAVQAISAVASGFAALMVVRALSGIIFGVLYLVAIASAGRSTNAQKTFAGAAAISLVVGTVFNPLLGFGTAQGGYVGVLAGLSVYCLFFALPLLIIRVDPAITTDNLLPQAAPAVDWITAAGVLGIMALLTIASNGTLLFSVQIAGRVGLRGAELGGGLAVVSLISALGGVLASWVGMRFGNFIPLAVGLGMMGAMLYGLTIVATQTQFWIAITLIVGLFWFLSPYIFGMAIGVDAAGRLASVTGSTKILASAVGSAIAGSVAERVGVVPVGMGAAALCGCAILLAWFVTLAAENSSKRY